MSFEPSGIEKFNGKKIDSNEEALAILRTFTKI